MFIQTEDTPNPNTLKFFPGLTILDSGTAEFTNVEEAQSSQLASLLFNIKYVTRIMFGHDFISVSKSQDTAWDIIKPDILTCIMEYFVTNDENDILSKVVPEEESKVEYNDDDSEIVEQIQELIHTRIKPAVMQDGGDIAFRKYKDGIVFLQLRGACAGCPSAAITLKDGIEDMLKYYVPEVKSVEAIE